VGTLVVPVAGSLLFETMVWNATQKGRATKEGCRMRNEREEDNV
jgi:hypothetical protein